MYWAIAQFGIAISALLIFPATYFLGGGPKEGHFGASVAAGVAFAAFAWAYVECLYLSLAWKKVNRHEPCVACVSHFEEAELVQSP